MTATLYIVATPIGNLNDISARLRSSIKQSDLILAEDTRVTAKLLHFLGLKKSVISYHHFNERSRVELVISTLRAGKNVALVSDAGTPLISDPGEIVIQACIEEGFEIVAIPGPTAFVQALILSGLNCERFYFEGFLPDNEKQMNIRLQEIKNYNCTLIFYVSPHKLEMTVKSIAKTLGNRKACLARELTKKFEEYIRGNLNDLLANLDNEKRRGEFTLVIDKPELSSIVKDNTQEVRNLAIQRVQEKTPTKKIVEEITILYDWKKNAAYALVEEVRKAIQES